MPHSEQFHNAGEDLRTKSFLFNFVIEISWVLMLLSCFIDRWFVRYSVPTDRRLQVFGININVILTCTYPLFAVAWILWNFMTLDEDIVTIEKYEMIGPAFAVVKLFYILGALLIALWSPSPESQFALIRTPFTLPLHVGLFTLWILPLSLVRTFFFAPQRLSSCTANKIEYFGPAVILCGISIFVLGRSLKRYIQVGFGGDRRKGQHNWVPILAVWLIAFIVQSVVQHLLFRSIVRRGAETRLYNAYGSQRPPSALSKKLHFPSIIPRELAVPPGEPDWIRELTGPYIGWDTLRRMDVLERAPASQVWPKVEWEATERSDGELHEDIWTLWAVDFPPVKVYESADSWGNLILNNSRLLVLILTTIGTLTQASFMERRWLVAAKRLLETIRNRYWRGIHVAATIGASLASIGFLGGIHLRDYFIRVSMHFVNRILLVIAKPDLYFHDFEDNINWVYSLPLLVLIGGVPLSISLFGAFVRARRFVRAFHGNPVRWWRDLLDRLVPDNDDENNDDESKVQGKEDSSEVEKKDREGQQEKVPSGRYLPRLPRTSLVLGRYHFRDTSKETY